MSSMSTIFRRTIKILRHVPGRLLHLLKRENFRKLSKAIREEPPDLILENFWKLIRTGQPQDPYPPQFIDDHADLKFHMLHCRKEKGILKVVIWCLARHGLQQAGLYCGTRLLSDETYHLIKPELSEMYVAFSSFEQRGLIFELAYDGLFSELSLQLQDTVGNTYRFAIGSFWLRAKEFAPAQILTHKLSSLDKKIVLLITDWGVPEDAEIPVHSILCREDPLPEYPVEIILCGDVELPRATDLSRVGSGVRQLAAHLVNDHLQQLEFDYLVHLSLDALIDTAFFPALLSFLEAHPDADLVYFDEALFEGTDHYHSTTLKPAFSPEYLVADNYIGSAYGVSASMIQKLGWFIPDDFSSGSYSLWLRSLAHHPEVYRIPDVRIYLPDYPRAAYAVKDSWEQYFRQKWLKRTGNASIPAPLLSIIIPFKDQIGLLKTCLESIYRHTGYTRFEILLISNNSEEKRTYEFLETAQSHYPDVRSLRWDHPFNYAALNNWAVEQARGEVLLFLNNDVKVLTGHWLKKMLSYLHSPEVGAVGAKLLYPDDTVQHAGVIIGIGGIAAHAHKHLPAALGGYAGRAGTVQNVSAVTAACLLIRRSVFESVSGFDAKNLPIAFNDVDLCLKVRAAGYRIVYCPEVVLYHYESISRGAEDTPAKRRRARKEIRFFRRKWRSQIRSGDPYYHPGFTDRRADFEA
jgi:GT2 family glycosyltransferase